MNGVAHSMTHENWPWLALILLGAYHGLNPAMGPAGADEGETFLGQTKASTGGSGKASFTEPLPR